MIRILKKEIIKTNRVVIYYAGAFVGEQSINDVSSIDPHIFKCPRNAYAFKFIETASCNISLDGEELSPSHSKDISPTYFPDAKLYSIDELKTMNAGTNLYKILISNMENNNPGQPAIKTKTGWWQPFEKGKTVLIDSEADHE